MNSKQADLETITERFLVATARIGEDYFAVPFAGSEGSFYRERVYCYELYHQWRTLWPADFGYSLCGEVDKSGHEFIKSKTKPDFLVHHAGDMGSNLLIVEVKSSKQFENGIDGAAKDMATLTYFLTQITVPHGAAANYLAAYWLVFGLHADAWPALRDKILQHPLAVPDWRRIACFIHQKDGTPAVQVHWE